MERHRVRPGSGPAPARVENVEKFWFAASPEISPRCVWWINRIQHGWKGNKRTRVLGYDEGARYFGVYIYEYVNFIYPLLKEQAEIRKVQK